MKVFQIFAGMCYWRTPFNSVSETEGKFPPDCLFVEAPDYVHESWGYKEVDDDGNPLTGDDRFIRPEAPEGWLYDDETGTFYLEEDAPVRLEAAKVDKQKYNKELFASFLENHPITWKDGKRYGVTMEDQSEIQFNLTQYNIQKEQGVENPVLNWHAVHEECTEWSYEDLSDLYLQIQQFVHPWFLKMNEYKSAIYSAENRQELDDLRIEYITEEEQAARDAEDALREEKESTDREEHTVEHFGESTEDEE